MTPTARSLRFLREQGWVADVVERRMPGCAITKDFLGFADILAVRPGELGVQAVQTTTRAHQAHRYAKVQASGYLSLWLAAGNRAVVHGWAKVGKRGARKTWEVTVQEVTA
jgi:hypothetical protein